MQLVEPYSPTAQEPLQLRLARWQRDVPLYRDLYRGVTGRANSDGLDWERLPFVTRREMGLNFPRNFLREGVELSTLIDRSEVELEHTSGTSGERQPLLLGVGWWAEQEFRALRLNRLVSRHAPRSNQIHGDRSRRPLHARRTMYKNSSAFPSGPAHFRHNLIDNFVRP
jgi:hypothetical protein